jgi:hypothetical protein
MKRWRCPKRRVIPLAEQRLMAERANSQITEISGTPLDALLHPMDEPYGGIADKADRWIFVHFAQLVLTPFLAAGVWMLLEGIESIPALVARAFLALWMVFFSAVNAVAGIATGVLTRHANSLAGEDREGVVAAIDFLWNDSRLAGGGFSVLGNLGHFSWVVVSIAATVALYRTGVSRVVVGATFLSCSSQPTLASGLQSG